MFTPFSTTMPFAGKGKKRSLDNKVDWGANHFVFGNRSQPPTYISPSDTIMSPCTAKLSAYKNKHFLKYVLTPHPTSVLYGFSPSLPSNKCIYLSKASPHADNGEKNRAKPQSLFAKMDAQKKEAKPPAATAGEKMEQQQEDGI